MEVCRGTKHKLQLLLVEYEVEASAIRNIRAMAQGHLGDDTYEVI